MESLRKLREAKGYTQRQLAEELGLSQQTYANYESGRREPDLLTLQKIANNLSVTIDFLVTGKNPNDQDFVNNKMIGADLSFYIKLNDIDIKALADGFYNFVSNSSILKFFDFTSVKECYRKIMNWISYHCELNVLEKYALYDYLPALMDFQSIDKNLYDIYDIINKTNIDDGLFGKINTDILIDKIKCFRFTTSYPKLCNANINKLTIKERLYYELSYIEWAIVNQSIINEFSADIECENLVNNYLFNLLGVFPLVNHEKDIIFSAGMQKLEDSIQNENVYVNNAFFNRHSRIISFLADLGISKIENTPIEALTNEQLETLYYLILYPIKKNRLLMDSLKKITINELESKYKKKT